MRALVLSIIACLAAPGIALAQHRLPVDPFPEQGPVLVEEAISNQVFEVRYREVAVPALRDGTGFWVPLGSANLVTRSESYYPADNQKIRNDSVHLSWPYSDQGDVLLGAWRFKHHREGLDNMRVLSYGIGLRHRF